MNNTKQILILVVVVSIALSFTAWCYVNQSHQSPAHIVIVVDRSKSITHRCSSLSGLVSRSLSLPNINKKSTITILGTGDPGTAFEPVLISSFQVPGNNKILEGKDKAKKARQDILHKVNKDCQQLKKTDYSPIYLSVKRGVEQLQVLGCQSDSDCRLWVLSDGLETEEKEFTNRINHKPSNKSAPTIDNSCIQITFCGLSETQDKGKPHSVKNTKALNTIWKSFFTEPRKTVLQPFCPKLNLKEKE